jgi:hypothetical protein
MKLTGKEGAGGEESVVAENEERMAEKFNKKSRNFRSVLAE